LAGGRKISVEPFPEEIMYFIFAKEFHWTPSQVDSQGAKILRGINTVMSTYNKVKNQEMKRLSTKR